MRLVLAEKPSVARDLAQVVDPGARRQGGSLVGRQFTWTWALGHLVELSPPETYQPALQGRWRTGLLPVIPERFTLRPREGRSDQLETIQRLLGDAEEVIVATDAGREGELVWCYIRDLSGYEGPVRRLWLSESTPAAVREAFAHLRPPMVALEAAARARSEADWLVGMNGTMALSSRYGGLWSTGRVQTPTLSLVCQRERDIRCFRPAEYCIVLGTFAHRNRPYSGQWFRQDEDRIEHRTVAEAIVAAVRGQPGKILAVHRKKTKSQPPRLLNLTDLQRMMNVRYGMTASATLAAAQALYEQHKILSYPRTDARHVSRETQATFVPRLQALTMLGGDVAEMATALAAAPPDPGKRVVDDSKVTDHHALLPTATRVDPTRLSDEQRRVYEAVGRRFVAALLPPAVYDTTEVITEVGGETFRSRSRVLVTAGWRQAEPTATSLRSKESSGEDEDGDLADGEEGEDLSNLRKGVSIECRDAHVEARQTKPPSRYTEASLLAAMEHAGRLVEDEALADAMKDRGLGTPATRAAIIEVLLRREYIRREGRSLVPTLRGHNLLRLVPASLREPSVTGDWEARLRRIETGQEDVGVFMADIRTLTKDIVDRIKASGPGDISPTVGICPRCGGVVVEGRTVYSCENTKPEQGACRWSMPKFVEGIAIRPALAYELLQRGHTEKPVDGLRKESGETFAARLQLDRETGAITTMEDA